LIVGQGRLSLLDNSVWNALSTTHASFAEVDELAKRYPVDVAPFAATRDQCLESYHSLAKLLGPGETVALPLARVADLPAGWTIVRNVNSAQMVWNGSAPPPAKQIIVDLSVSHIDEMLALVELTNARPLPQKNA
jgi:hypothetical protein